MFNEITAVHSNISYYSSLQCVRNDPRTPILNLGVLGIFRYTWGNIQHKIWDYHCRGHGYISKYENLCEYFS